MSAGFSEDKFLNGRVIVRQPLTGFRSGLDAVMLAAAIPAQESDEVLELGSGAGAASLCLAKRTGCSVIGLEIDQALAALADENAAENELPRAMFTYGDIHDVPSQLRRAFDHVMCNPPFHDDEGRASPDQARALALQDRGSLGDWLKEGMRRVVSNGTFTTILRGDRIGEALVALGSYGVSIFPLWPRRDAPAKRLIVQIVKSSRTPLAVLPGLVLHEGDGRYTPAANMILRDGAALHIG